MKEEASFSYTLSSLCECQPCPASNSRPGSPGTDSDVDDGHLGHRSPAATAFFFDRRRSRDRVSIVFDPDHLVDENDA